MNASIVAGPTKMMYYCRLWTLIFASLISVCVHGEITVSVSSSSNPAKESTQHILTCSFTNPDSEFLTLLAWNKDALSRIAGYARSDGFVSYNGSYGEPGDYIMSEPNLDAAQGSSSLTVTSVSLNDIGVFNCEVRTLAPRYQAGITLDVYVPPSSAELSTSSVNFTSGELAEVVAGNSYEFRCKTIGVRPKPIFEWTDRIADGQTDLPNSDDRLFDSTSVSSTIPEFVNHKDQLDCSAYVAADPTEKGTSYVVFDVKVPPSSTSVYLTDASGRLGEGMEVRVDENVQHVFTCNVEDTRPAAMFGWEVNNTQPPGSDFTIGPPVAPTAGDLLVDSSQTLTISNPQRSHHGSTMKCIANIDVTESTTPVATSVSLNVYGPPDKPILIGNTGDMTEGTAEILQCKSNDAFPEGGFRWFHDNQDITGNAANNTLNGDNRFDISSSITFNPTKSNNGNTIKCKVTHETLGSGQELSTSAQLNVKYSPSDVLITQSPQNPVVEGDEVTLTCTSDANPVSIDFDWIRSGSDNNVGDGSNIHTFERISRNDEGVYTCKARNGIGSDGISPPVSIVVYYPPENVVVIKSIDGPLLEGNDLTLNCTSGGIPAPNQYNWIKDGIVIKNENNYQLVFGNIMTGNAGFYQCEAGNGVGSIGRSNVVDIEVHYSPIIEKETDVKRVNPGDNVIFECIAEGLPIPIITWVHPNQSSITNATDRMTIVDTITFQDGVHGTVIVSNLLIEEIVPETDYGTYVCEARNEIGQYPDVLHINLNGTTVPEPVKELKVISTGQNFITVGWNPGNTGGETLEQSAVVVYRLYADNVPGEWSAEYEVPKGDMQYAVSNLLAGSTYDIQVFSENVLGRNEDGPIVQGITKGEPIDNGPRTDPNIGGIIGGVIGSTVAVGLVVVLIVYFRKNYLRDNLTGQKTETKSDRAHFHHEEHTSNEMEMTDRPINNDTPGLANKNPALELNSDCYANIPCSSVRLAFPRRNLHVLRELGRGEFGKVLMAKAVGLFGGSETTTVAVKTLHESTGVEAKNQLRKEFEVMKLLTMEHEQKNPHVVQLLGACMEKDPMYVILEYMPKGDLKSLLRKSRVGKREINCNSDSPYGNLVAGSTSFTPPQLLTFARDVANGMAFLAEQKCIHRDLAARNVLLNEHLVCKVSDFGLARDVKDVEIYQRLSECRLPLRWMAYESVIGDVHTIESDVWSFGVLLWEIVTLGGRPYPRMNGVEIRQLLKAGNRMPQPKHCSQQLYTIMSMCWEKEPKNRPTFVQLIPLLDDIIIGQMGYLSMEDLETTLYEDSSAPDANEKV